ncbi:SAM-dependent methyltransferase [Micromonospora endophytica]|uniref:SAM-dependent methyltransferase n=2 Tax=Micromonospora endophytica TaxID=515350 RepID=A0A2W2CL51_9ACTN|nr:SAM-dependent methyltransferase [Micromonospora endophytica]RIW45277.1 methyltransferase domain-containing protein [Micromonospora endophytica]
MEPPDAATPAEFWESLHQQVAASPWELRVNPVLAAMVGDLSPGAALDLGCGQGGDSLWFAQRGWQVTAVDIADAALQRVNERAAQERLSDRIRTERHDLVDSLPSGRWDLVSAHYLQSLFEFPRARILRELGEQVNRGGMLLIVDHGSVAPWSWNQGATIPTPEETLAGLALDPASWQVLCCEARVRTATGPGGQTAEVTDNVIALRRTA